MTEYHVQVLCAADGDGPDEAVNIGTCDDGDETITQMIINAHLHDFDDCRREDIRVLREPCTPKTLHNGETCPCREFHFTDDDFRDHNYQEAT